MSRTILLHVCCGPCLLYPLEALRSAGIEPVGYFYNPNIHPLLEFERRVEALEAVVQAFDMEMIWDERLYGLEEWLLAIGERYHRPDRCHACYRMRLWQAARVAASSGLEAFSTTLLYSRYQDHEAIVKMAQEAASAHSVAFHYQDFREGWQQGIEASRRLGIYRQPYCGCVFSEAERYAKRLSKMRKRLSMT